MIEWLSSGGDLIVGVVMVAFVLGLTIGMKVMDR